MTSSTRNGMAGTAQIRCGLGRALSQQIRACVVAEVTAVLGRRPSLWERLCTAGFWSLVALCSVGLGHAAAASWAVMPSPSNGELKSVSCTSWSACTAVGFAGTSTEAGTLLAEHWNGARWSVQSLSPPSGGQSEFTNVSCGSPRFCVADGILVYGSTFTGRCALLVGMWNGLAWSIRKVPMCVLGGALSCASRRFCVMLGLPTEVWNGSRWARMRVPRKPLTAVACRAATSCAGIAGQSFVRWNGRTWSVIAPLDTNVAAGPVGFGPALSCSSPSACTVIGANTAGDNEFSLVERWNGRSWSMQPGAAVFVDGFGAFLSGVSCSGVRTCTIVGSFGPPYGAFTERWNGARWSRQPIATPVGAVPQGLSSVWCGAARCMAVGYSLDGKGQAQTLVEQYR